MINDVLTYNNGQIYYEVKGSGEPIVFIHAFTLDHNMWKAQVESFSKKYRVITYDARGFGQSSLPEQQYDHVADLRALLEHLSIKHAHVVGLSMGGRIAVNFALEYPEMVTTLTLMDSALDGYEDKVDRRVYAKEQGLERAKENWLNHELFATIRQRPEIAVILRRIIENYSGWHWLHDDLRYPADTHAYDRLHEIIKPTLIIVGEGDLDELHNIATALEAGIMNSQKVVIANAGHMVNMEASEEVNKLLVDFITRF